MNYYAQVIEIITSERTDWRDIVTKIAMKHPKIVVDAAQIEWKKEGEALVKSGNKIAAIKLCRSATGMGLKEAKEYVESLWEF